MAKVEIKQPVVDEIKAKVEGAVTIVLVDYRGLTVEQDTRLRKNLREAGCEYKVYKNTLMKRAFEGTDCAQLDALLEGPSAIAISKDDATAPIRILNNMAKEADALEFKAAIVEGNFYDADGVKALADAVRKLMTEVGIPLSIKEAGEKDKRSYIDEKTYNDALEGLAYKAFDDQCTTANPRLPRIDELKDLYKKAYYGK